MAKASKAKQITIALPNKVGTLAQVSEVLGGAKININALCGWGDKKKAMIFMVTDSHMKAKNAFAKTKVEVSDEDVILVEMPNKPGEMQKVAQKIADAGIDILYNYGSAGGGRTSFCVFKTDNDKKALKVLQGK